MQKIGSFVRLLRNSETCFFTVFLANVLEVRTIGFVVWKFQLNYVSPLWEVSKLFGSFDKKVELRKMVCSQIYLKVRKAEKLLLTKKYK